MSKKGFTLIELLVVIAIIGILASIVLVTFPTAQDRARDARIINALSQFRTEAVIYYDDQDPDSYLGLNGIGPACIIANTNFETLCQEVSDNDGSATVVADADTYCAYSALNVGSKYYCVDNSGAAYEGITDPGAVGSGCDATPYECP